MVTNNIHTASDIINQAIDHAVEGQVAATEAQVFEWCDVHDYDDVEECVFELMVKNPEHLREAVEDAWGYVEAYIRGEEIILTDAEIASIRDYAEMFLTDKHMLDVMDHAAGNLVNSVWDPVDDEEIDFDAI